MLNKGVQRVGDIYANTYAECANRTGATLAKGSVVALDFALAATETTSVQVGNAANVFANVITVTQAIYDAGVPLLVAMEEIEDNEVGQFLVFGVADVLVLDDDTSTTDVDAGDQISMVVSESAIAVQAAAATDHRVVGHAFEDAAASGSNGDSSLKACLWHGGIPNLGYTRDA